MSFQSFHWVPCALRLLFPLLLLSCKNPPPAEKEKKTSVRLPIQVAPEGSRSDTLVIREPAAVFFVANTEKRDALKKRMGEGPFDGVDHECFYQMKNARTSLREHWPHIRLYEVKDTLVLAFVRRDGQVRRIDLQDKRDLCGLYLFNPDNDPAPGDMMNIGTSLENYFLK